jgi:hypothetical protein
MTITMTSTRTNGDVDAASIGLDPEFVRALLERPEEHPDLRLVKSRARRGTVRSVYVYRERDVIKHYGARPWGVWWSPYWRREHEALERLRGLPMPESRGYFRARIGSYRSAVYVRECVACEPLTDVSDPVAPQFMPEIARLMAEVHRRGVITSDYSLFNIRRRPSGELVFIDFHRARVFQRKTAAYWFYVGSDLAQFYRTPCRRRADLFQPFLVGYFAAMGEVTPQQRRFAQLGFRMRCWQKFEPAPHFPTAS